MCFFPHGLVLKCRTDWHRGIPQCYCQQSALEGLLAVQSRDHAKMSDFVDSDYGPKFLSWNTPCDLYYMFIGGFPCWAIMSFSTWFVIRCRNWH